MIFLPSFLSYIQLPNPLIPNQAILCKEFLNYGIRSMYEAIDYVHQLPYGRTSNRADYLAVLSEQKGACSGKHALIVALAGELQLSLHLCLGVFMLSAINTPKVSSVLQKHKLTELPEAHCYLKFKDHRFDITFPENNSFAVTNLMQQEIVIHPKDIGSFKIQWHQQIIQQWIIKNKLEFTLQEIWDIRETCISAQQQMSLWHQFNSSNTS